MLKALSPPPGINSDDTTFDAQGRWADGNNVRFYNDKPQPIGGWRTLESLAVPGCRNLFLIEISSTIYVIYGGGSGGLYAGSGAPSSLGSISATDRGWSFDAYGQT